MTEVTLWWYGGVLISVTLIMIVGLLLTDAGDGPDDLPNSSMDT